MTVQIELQEAWFQRAKRVLPGGGIGNYPGDTIIKSGRGARVWDVAGREYVDLLIGSGPMLIGHGHPEVTTIVTEMVGHGTTFFVSNEYAILLAEEIVEAVPCAEKVRYTCTGTEADAYAMRLVRAHRRRDKILKFEGGYHGMSDYALMSLWSGKPADYPNALVDSAGIPANVSDNILVAPYNDLSAAQSIIHAHRDELAGVLVEPMQRRVAPVPGFLAGLRDITEQYRIPLIFDEVVTGFRLAYGGGQAFYGVTPDLCTLGKVIGGGFPLAAIAGREEIMAHFDRAVVGSEGFTPQIGTLSGNPIAAAAGWATLRVLKREGAYDRLRANGNALREGMSHALRDAGFTIQMTGEAPVFDAVFTDVPVHDHRGSLTGDSKLSQRFDKLLRERGVFKTDGKVYVSHALEPTDIAHVNGAFASAAKALAETMPN